MKNLFNFIFILSFSFVFSQNQIEGTLLDTDYEPVYYRLEMNLNPYQSDFSGKTTVHFNTTDDLIEFQINAKPNLTIESVVYHQNNISNYSRNGDVLSIQLPAQLPANRLDSIAISFSGNESSSHGLTLGQHAGVPIIETLAEPWHGSTWWVCKDDLDDKVAKMDVYVTHPSEFKAGSNGLLKSVSPAGSGMSVTHWQHNYPIPVYLVGIAVTNYAEYNNSVNIGGTTVPIINYLYPETMSNWTDNLDDVPSHITKMSERFGDYPYKNEKYGHAQWNRGGGMEHSTMSFMGSFSFNLIVHELAHQWFGDKVTCATWHDIWLNEGFADYCTGLMTEDYFGEQPFKNWKSDRIDIITSQNGGSVYNPDAENEGRIFNSRLTYKKGSMVVHLIRYMINDDELFFQSLRNYLDDPDFAWDFADTQDFKESLEASTGMNWDYYFNDWIYGEGHPILNISVSKTLGSNEVVVQIDQSGSHSSVPFFHFPLEIKFMGSGGQIETKRFEVNSPSQSFTVNDLGFNVASYQANPGFDIICQINSSVLKTDENVFDSDLSFYPNPATDFLNLISGSEIKQIEIFDASGNLVYKQSKTNKTKLQIPVNSWTKGVYFIQVQTKDKKIIRKFLKE